MALRTLLARRVSSYVRKKSGGMRYSNIVPLHESNVG